MNFTRHLAIVVVTAALTPITALAHQKHSQIDPALGAQAPISAATRTVEVTANTRYVRVNQGDVVRLQVNGKTVGWQFDTLGTRSFDLSAIVPEAIDQGHTRVYVDQNPLYRN
jgi:hypothetical protein